MSHIRDISFPFEANLAELLYQQYDTREFVGAVATYGIVRDSESTAVARRVNPDRDDCWYEFGDDLPWSS